MIKAIARKFQNRVFRLKFTSNVLIVLAVLLFLYLILLPLFPAVQYELVGSRRGSDSQDLAKVKQEVAEIKKQTSSQEQDAAVLANGFPESGYSVSDNRLIIPKISVNAPIVESRSADYGLAKGAWRLPDTSTPPQGGNTVITGHRFKYLPPNNLTFYLFHKLEAGDIVSVLWEGEEYYYSIKETKVVEPTQVSITDPTREPRLTLFTCHPIYSQKQRLVVVAEPVE
jgi:LPXTG-site transpeptidase (sortase) family protein